MGGPYDTPPGRKDVLEDAQRGRVLRGGGVDRGTEGASEGASGQSGALKGSGGEECPKKVPHWSVPREMFLGWVWLSIGGFDSAH